MAKKHYKYYNRNPDNRHIKDCVCRAISTATGLYYEAVNNLLEITAEEYGCEALCVCCYDNLLSGILCYRREDCGFTKTVAEISASYPQNSLIIRIDSHLTSSINGTVLDIWDCTDSLVDCFWIVK